MGLIEPKLAAALSQNFKIRGARAAAVWHADGHSEHWHNGEAVQHIQNGSSAGQSPAHITLTPLDLLFLLLSKETGCSHV